MAVAASLAAFFLGAISNRNRASRDAWSIRKTKVFGTPSSSSHHENFRNLYTCLTREYRGSERCQILRQSGLKPTGISGFLATMAARSIKSRIACGYEYTGVFRTCEHGAPLCSNIPAGHIPKKIKQNVSHGAKKPGRNLFSCYPEILLILLFLVCII